MDERDQQLDWEQRVGRAAAIAAFAAALLFFAFLIYSNSIFSGEETASDDTVDGLFLYRDHRSEVLLAAVLQTISTALLAVPLWFLYEATKFRRPETPQVARWLALVGPPLVGALLLVRQIQVADVAEAVYDHLRANPMPPGAANDYAEEQLRQGGTLISAIRAGAGLAMAFAFVMIALNAMRAGLLSRFMGILGIIVGVLFVIPLLGPVPIVMLFWIAALGFLFLGKWPQGGRGAAWDSGEAIAWPTAADRQAELVAARAERDAEAEEEEYDEPHATATNGGDARHEARQPRSKKRKRKRR